MTRRRLIVGLLTAGLLAAGFGASVLPASAQLRSVTATLLDGTTVTATVDVPPGTPLDKITIPGVTQPIVSIVENLPAGASPSVTTPAGTTSSPSPTAVTTPAAAQPSSEPQTVPGGQTRQKTTGRKKHKAKVKVKGTSLAGPAKLPARSEGGVPTPANPTFSAALPLAAPLGVPDFFIEKFRVPLFLLPIYQAAANEYNVPWQVLAAINEIETNYGRDLSVSSAKAEGWMQFLPSTWAQYGVDANQDGKKDPYNPADAIFAAARYLSAAGAATNLRGAIFAYNHATWYVDSVILRAKLIGGLPDQLLGSLTGLTQGSFPVYASARYADDPAEAAARRARGLKPNTPTNGIDIFAKAGAPVIAVQDGRVVGMGVSKRLGRYIQLRDAFGNTYTYSGLEQTASSYPVPKPRKVTAAEVARELRLPGAHDPRPSAPASAGHQPASVAPAAPVSRTPSVASASKQRLFANPLRPSSYRAGGSAQLQNVTRAFPASATLSAYFTQAFGLRRSDIVLKPLVKGATLIAGTVIGRIGHVVPGVAPHVLFQIRPAGRGAPLIDPKPVLDGWKLLESTAIYRAAGRNPFLGPDAKNPSIGQLFLMSKEALQLRVLQDPSLSIYDCGRRDIQAGEIDRRVLATIEFLSGSGFKPTITALKCGHSLLTSSGNVSEHSSGDAVDVGAVNGIAISGHQGAGSITDNVIRRLLTLQGLFRPHQIISLMTYRGADNTLSLPDHADHIHIGFLPMYSSDPRLAAQVNSVLKPKQWIKLIDRLRQIQNPVVATSPSKAAIPAGRTGGD